MTEIVLGIKLTADGKGLVGEVKLSREELDKLTAATKGTGAEAAKAKGEMMSWTEFVKQRMGPAMREFHQQGKTHAEAHTLAIRQIGQEWQEYKRTGEAAAVTAGKLNEEHKGLARTLNQSAGSIGAYVALWNQAADVLVRAAQAAKNYVKDAALLNARHETLGVVMRVVGRNAGYTAAQMEAEAEATRKLGITMIASRQAVIDLAQSQIELSMAHQLARAAQDAAVIAGINSSEAFQRMVYGIKSGQTEVLRTMGLNVNFEASYAKLAKQLKINTDQLTDQEKLQARANVVLEKTVSIAGAYEAAMGTAGKQLASLARYEEDLKTLRGQIFNEALVIAVNAYTDALKDANEEARRLSDSKKLQEWGRDIVTTFAWAADAIRAAWMGVAQFIESSGVVVLRLMQGVQRAREGMGLSSPLAAAEFHAFVESFEQSANENAAARLKWLSGPQFRGRAEEFFAQRDADAAERARQAQEDLRDMAMARALGLRVGPAPAARPGGNAKREGADLRDYVRQLQQHVEITSESTILEKVQFELREKHWKNATPQLVAQAEAYAQQLDQQKTAKQALDAYLTSEEMHAEVMRETAGLELKRSRANAAAVPAMEKNLEQIEFETSLIGLSSAEREKAIALRALEAEKINLSAGELERYREKLTAALDARKARESAQKQIEETAAAAKKMGDDINRGLTDALMRGFESGKTFAANFRDTLANMFKTLVLRPVIQWIISPLSGAITATLGGLGIPGMANAAAGAAGGLGGLGNLLSLGGGVSGLLGGAAALPNALFQNLGVSFGSQSLADIGNYGFGSPIMGALLSLAMGNTRGALGSAALGSVGALFGGPIGGLLGSAVGGLFGLGGGKISTSALPEGDVVARLDAQYAQLAGALGASGSPAFAYGANTGRQGASPNFALSSISGAQRYQVGEYLGSYRTLDEATLSLEMSRAVLSALQGSQLPQAVRKYFDTLVPASLTQQAIDQALQFSAALKQTWEALERGTLELGEFTAEFQRALEQGLTPETLAQWQQFGGQFNTLTQNLRGIVTQLPGTLGITGLTQARDQLAVSAYRSPLERFGAARSQLDAVYGRAIGGDLSAVQAFPQLLQQSLAIGRDVYASGGEFQELFVEGNRKLNDLLARQQDLQTDILQEVPVAIRDAANDQIAEIRKQTSALVAELQAVKAELRRLAA